MPSVVASDLKLYQATVMAANATTSNIGGAISASQITGATIGEALYTMGSPTSGSPLLQYSKIFIKNTNSTTPLTGSVIYLANSLDDVAINGTVTAVSSSSADDNTYKITVLGFDAGGSPQSEDITMNGFTVVNGLLTWSVISRVEFHLVSSGALTPSNGQITITRNVVLGYIQAGYYSATSEIKIGLEATLDGTTTTTNSATAPGGVTFSKPRTQPTGLAVANAGSLTNGHAQSIWILWTLAVNAKPSADIQMIVAIEGQTT